MFPVEITNTFGDRVFCNREVDPRFGQQWNLANLRAADLYYFGNTLYPIRTDPAVVRQVNVFYEILVQLNPELSNIMSHNIEMKLDVIQGVGSGLHFNDIQYFVEELGGTLDNQSENDRSLEKQVEEAYFKRHGIDMNADFSTYTQDDLKLFDQLQNKIGFAFCPETARRIIDDEPYTVL